MSPLFIVKQLTKNQNIANRYNVTTSKIRMTSQFQKEAHHDQYCDV